MPPRPFAAAVPAMADRRVETIEHHIGPAGLVTLDIVQGSVRVRGADGEDALVTVRMPAGEDPAAILNVLSQEEELSVDVRGMSPATLGLRGLLRRELPSIDLDVTMPRMGRLNVNGVSADLHVNGIHGGQRHRTVSGDLDAVGVEGSLTMQAVSGDVRIEGGRYEVELVTTSGDVEIHAECLLGTRLRSVSGDIDLAGEFAAGSSHRVETVSGDLRIAPIGGLTVAARGFSTRIHSQLPHRSASHGARRTVVIGDGRANLDFRSMSGDVSVVEGSSEHGYSTDGAAPPAPPAPPATPSSPSSLAPPAPPAERSSPEKPPLPAAHGPAPLDQLSILRALERGEIDVDEATRLLEDNDDA